MPGANAVPVSGSTALIEEFFVRRRRAARILIVVQAALSIAALLLLGRYLLAEGAPGPAGLRYTVLGITLLGTVWVLWLLPRMALLQNARIITVAGFSAVSEAQVDDTDPLPEVLSHPPDSDEVEIHAKGALDLQERGPIITQGHLAAHMQVGHTALIQPMFWGWVVVAMPAEWRP